MFRICIVIPTSDSFGTLPEAIESALAQRHADFHVYVSDNASTDGTQNYLSSLRHESLTAQSHSLRVGKTENWNRAFSSAPSSKFLVMLHSDDVLYPGALSDIDAAFKKWPSAALVYGNHDILSVDGADITEKRAWPCYYVSVGRRFDRLQVLLNAVSIVGCAFPRELFERIGGFPREYNFYQDMEFFHRLAQIGPAVYVPCKFGLNRGTPPRPLNRLRYYCEEITWLKRQIDVWPSVLERRIQMAWVTDACYHLRSDFPETLLEYTAHLERNGMRVDETRLKLNVFPKLLLHRIYKLWLTLLSFVHCQV